MALTNDEVAFGRSKGSRTRAAILRDASTQLRERAEAIMQREEKLAAPPTIIDIQVYEDKPYGIHSDSSLKWVRYSFSDGDVKKFRMPAPEAGAIKTAWEAGIRKGAQGITAPRYEDDEDDSKGCPT
jgi:hypothetical protein